MSVNHHPGGACVSGTPEELMVRIFEHQKARQSLIERWLNALDLAPGQVLADVGSGPGLSSLLASERLGSGGHVYAVDPSPEALAFLAARVAEREAAEGHSHGRPVARITGVPADAREAALPAPADAALVTHVLHHVRDPLSVLRAVRRMVRPGARVVVAEFDPQSPGEIGPPPAERIPPATLRSLVERAGFTVLGTVVEGEQEQYAMLAAAAAAPQERFETLAIHAGQPPDPGTGAVVVPIYQTSTFAQSAPGQHRGYEYARTGNPTRAALEAALAALEGGRFGLAFASGMAAVAAVGYTLRPGQSVLVPRDVYGGTWRFFARVLGPWGIQADSVDMTDLGSVEAALDRRPIGLVLLESPTNPALHVIDVAAVAAAAHRHGVRVAVDNTFASPYLQSPLALGADLVIHSTTKYLGGHSDVVGGAVVTSDDELAGALKFVQNAAGGVPGPFDSWLVLRGIKTLAVRMERHSANASRIAAYLKGHPAVERVFYPGLPDHPGHELAARQMPRGFGGMVSFIVRGGEAAARRVVSSTRLFTLGESLGGVESLIEHPASMTHLSLAGSPLAVDPGLVRLSVGIEHVDDLVDDLQQALSQAARPGPEERRRAGD